MRSGIVVAGGTGSRFGGDKLSCDILGSSVLQHSVNSMLSICDELIVVCDKSKWDSLPNGVVPVEGGATRSQSVMCGLRAISSNATVVAIHDGARPFVSSQLISLLFAEAESHGSAVPVCPIVDTMYSISGGQSVVDRSKYVTVQTPQVFDVEKLLEALANADDYATDEAQQFIDCHGSVHFVSGQASNNKVTFGGDIPSYRCGVGYDLHRMTSGEGIVLGGANIACEYSMVAHSDGDVLVHSIMDSLLSAIGDRDIGYHFPDTDEKYRGADSMVLLRQVFGMLIESGYEVVNVSAVIIAEKPRLSSYVPSMVRNIADILCIPTNCVGITVTTNEGVGEVGSCQAIAVHTGAMVCRKYLL